MTFQFTKLTLEQMRVKNPSESNIQKDIRSCVVTEICFGQIDCSQIDGASHCKLHSSSDGHDGQFNIQSI